MKRTILVVDDDLDLRDTVCTALADEGYDTAAASNGTDALERLRAGETPDLIILDLMMPGMDGWAFREEQKRDPRLSPIPVLVISASRRLDEPALDARYLRKPMDLDALLSVVSEMIGSPGRGADT